MLIKKSFEGSIPENKIMNDRTTTTTDTYSCDFMNGVTLYENSSGTTAGFTLSDSVANYKFLEVYTDTQIVKTWVNTNGNAVALLITIGNDGQTLIFNVKRLYFSETSVTNALVGRFYCYSPNGYNDTNNYMSIFKVVGYK